MNTRTIKDLSPAEVKGKRALVRALLAVAIGGGVLAKGPVVLLHLLPAALLAPWWLGRRTVRWGHWYAGVVLALIGGFAAAGSGQAPPDRAALVAFRDSLARVTDTLALRRLEGVMLDVARGDRDNTLLHLRLGLLAHRLGEAGGGKSHYEDAAGEFEWATELQSDWPWGWYGLGLADLALGEHDVIAIENGRQFLGKDSRLGAPCLALDSEKDATWPGGWNATGRAARAAPASSRA